MLANFFNRPFLKLEEDGTLRDYESDDLSVEDIPQTTFSRGQKRKEEKLEEIRTQGDDSFFPLLKLSQELVWEILKYLSPDDLFNLSLVSHHLYSLCNETYFLTDNYWKRLFDSSYRFPSYFEDVQLIKSHHASYWKLFYQLSHKGFKMARPAFGDQHCKTRLEESEFTNVKVDQLLYVPLWKYQVQSKTKFLYMMTWLHNPFHICGSALLIGIGKVISFLFKERVNNIPTFITKQDIYLPATTSTGSIFSDIAIPRHVVVQDILKPKIVDYMPHNESQFASLPNLSHAKLQFFPMEIPSQHLNDRVERELHCIIQQRLGRIITRGRSGVDISFTYFRVQYTHSVCAVFYPIYQCSYQSGTKRKNVYVDGCTGDIFTSRSPTRVLLNDLYSLLSCVGAITFGVLIANRLMRRKFNA